MPRCELCGEWPDCPWKTDPEIMCSEYHPKPRTNADRIRSMSDEELAAFLTDDFCELLNCYSPCDGHCGRRMLDWLKQEATE